MPLNRKFRKLQSDLSDAASDAARENGRVMYNAYSAAKRKIFAEQGYRAKYRELVKEVDEALKKVSKPSTRKALLDLKSRIYGELNSR